MLPIFQPSASLFPARPKLSHRLVSVSPNRDHHKTLPLGRSRRLLLAAAAASPDDVDAFTKFSGYIFKNGETSEAEIMNEYDLRSIKAIYRRKPLLVIRRFFQIGTTLGRWFALRYIDGLLERSDEMFEIRANELRLVLLELGPTFVKIAQAVSSRPAPRNMEEGEPSRQNGTPEIVMEENVPPVQPTPPAPMGMAAEIARAVALALLEFRNALPVANPVPPPAPVVPEVGMDRYLKTFKEFRPSSFKGVEGPMETEDWLDQTRELLSIMQCPENKKVPLAVFLLEGEAKRWWNRLITDDPAGRTPDMFPWTEFATALSNWFVPPSERRALQEKYLRLIQGDKTVSAYEKEFTHLSHYAGQLQGNEEDKCHRFREGLRFSLRQPLLTMETTSFRRVVDTARKLEADQEREQRRSNFKNKRTQDAAQHQQSRNQAGRQWNKKPKPGDNQSASNGNKVRDHPLCPKCHRFHPGECLQGAGVCYKCHQAGHIARFCPGPTGNQSKFEVGGPSRMDKGKAPMDADPMLTPGRSLVKPRAYGLGQQEAKDQEDVVTGTTGQGSH